MAGDEGFRLASAYVEIDPKLSDDFASKAKAQVDAATSDLTGTAKLTADDSDLTAKTAEASAKVDDFGSKSGTARLGADASDVDETVAAADAKVDEFGAKDEKAHVGVDDGDSNARLDEIIAKLDDINGKTVTARVNIDSSGGFPGISGMGALGIGGVLGGGALLPALPGALTGAGAAAGTLGLAIAGVSKALSDYSSGAKAASSATSSMASQQLSSAHTIAAAQQAVSQAETQAQHDAITSAEAIKNAQQGVAAAYQQAAQQQISAEEQLKSAQYSEQQAQQSLTQARQQAILTIQQLENASADAALNVQQDRLNLQQAEQTQQQVDASSTSTALQRAQAALAVKEAEQQLKEAIQNRTNSAKAAQTADKQGVAGNPSVLAAQHALAQAHQSVADAQRNLTQTEVNGARSIAQAQQQLADAQRNASWQQQADSRNVKNAQDNLAYAYASAGAAAGGAAKAGSAYAQDLAKLTPAGKQFVTAITGMMGALHSLEGVSEKALMPGLTAFLGGLKSIGPEISKEVASMGGLLSKGFEAIGKELESSGFQKSLQVLFNEGNKFISILGPAIGKFVNAFIDMGVKGGPALTGFAKMLSGILGGVDDLMTGLSNFSKAGGSIMITLGKAIGDLGGPLGTVIGVLNSAIAPLLAGALPLFKSLVDQIARVVKAAQPGLVGIGQALGQMLTALVPLLPPLGMLLVQMVKLVDAALLPLLPVLPKLIPPLVQLAVQGMQPMMLILTRLTPLISILAQTLAGVLMVALPPLTAALVLVDGAIQTVENDFISAVTSVSSIKNAWNDVASFTSTIWDGIAAYFTEWWSNQVSKVTSTLSTVKSLLSDAWHAINSAWDSAWNAIKDFFKAWWDSQVTLVKDSLGIAKTVLSAGWTAITTDAKAKWNGLMSFFKTFWSDLKAGFRDAVNGIATAWDKIENIMKTPVNWVISNVYDKLIVRFWNDIAGPVGLPKLAKLAGGGKIPGYGGGDILPALLEPGETVVSKEHSKLLAPAFQAAGVPGYAGGGVVTDVGGKVSGVWDGLIGGIGETFHKVIGSIEHDLRQGLALPMKAAGKVINAAASHVPGSAGISQVMKKAPGALWDGVTKMVMSTTAGSGTGGGGAKYTGHYGTGVTQWAGDISKVLAMLGEPASDLSAVEYRMNVESGGNPNAINLWDSNAKAGDPSRGLMQTIMTTFEAYAGPYKNRSIYDPLANIYAGINYAKHCVPLSTMILTRRGWLKYDEVQPGDETLGYNFATGRSEWTKVTAVHLYDDAPLVRVGNKRWSAICTPEHRWIVKAHGAGKAELRPTRGDVWTKVGRKPANLKPGISAGRNARIIVAAPAETGSRLDLTENEAELLGWILGDGSIRHRHRTCVEVSVTQSKVKNIPVIRRLLAGLPHSETVRPGGRDGYLDRHDWVLRAGYARDLLRRSGMDDDLERFVIELSPEQRAAFMRGICGAEGTVNHGSWTIPQNYGANFDAILLATFLEGHRPGVSHTMGNAWSANPSANIRHCRPVVVPENIEDAGRGPVWCVSTELETWTARQDDNIFLTGNSYAGRSLKSVMLQPGGYDSGGWLQPGGTNQTGRPEAVLTPQESAAFVALVKQLVGPGGARGGGLPGGGQPINVNYFGTQHPTPEQEQAMLLKLGATIGVA